MILTKYIPFRCFSELYLDNLKERSISLATFFWGNPVSYDTDSILRLLKSKVFPSIGDLRLMDFDVMTHRILMAHLKNERISHSYRGHIMGFVKNILYYAFHQGLVTKDIPESFHIRKDSSSRYTLHSDMETDNICQAAFNIYNAVMYPLASFSGLRGSEIKALYWSDIDPSQHSIHIQRFIGKEEGGISKVLIPIEPELQRTIFLTKQAWQLLAFQYSSEFQGKSLDTASELPEQLVFHKKDHPEQFLNHNDESYVLLKLKEASGVQGIGFKNLRHQYAVTALKETDDMIAVMTTMGYTTFCPLLGLQPYTSSIQSKKELTK